MLALADPSESPALIASAAETGYRAWVAGEVVAGSGRVRMEGR